MKIKFASMLLVILFFPALARAADSLEQITPSLQIIPGPVNGALIKRSGKVLAVYGDPRENPPAAEMVLFTHHRRDVAWAGRALAAGGARAVAPAAEAALFAGVDKFWADFEKKRFRDSAQQSTKILRAPIAIARAVRDGETIDWQGLAIRVVATPGFTRGAVSYLVELDGRRVAFTGDLIYGDGKLLDLYSLQDAISATREDGYHGYAARAGDLLASLKKIVAWKPDLLIPARGPLIRDPAQAIEKLTTRVQAVFASHFAIDALRWYRGDEKIAAQARRVLGSRPVEWMPTATTTTLPQWIVAIRNARLIVSASGAGFMIDCGGPQIMKEVQDLRAQGRAGAVEGLYITHYHNDHTDTAQAFADEFHCPVYACREQRDILERPGAYRLPCLTPNPIREVKAMADGAVLRWHEYEFTFSFFPGQTLYHGGLLVKKDGGESFFFAGDSFCPTGMDDYCLLNRNFFAPEPGYAQCLEALGKLKPETWLINQHVTPAFRFTAAQLETMTDNFRQRRALVAELVPWDDPNFGVDEEWARFDPYGCEASADRPVELKFHILNHSPQNRNYFITPRLPEGWTGPREALKLSIAPRREGTVSFKVTPPAGWRGLAVLAADVRFGEWDLREWSEALIRIR